ncbi:MAG: bifunctional [glutamate--ammonia ligase]-adenylyl-L-tyrosine phosphorylase/[glutamate--ammonia-ligase] adenylyltransferase [Byssovorax sp.]
MSRRSRLLPLAQGIDPDRSAIYAARFASSLTRGTNAHGVATLLGAAYPALAPVLEATPDIARRLAADGFATARDRPILRRRLGARVGDLSDPERVCRELRRFARDERIRIALRELLPSSLGGADVDVTAGELSALADVTIEFALGEAVHAVSARFGPARTQGGAPARFVVLGMGKLGGEELNAGSDIDLIYFYDTDDGAAEKPGAEPITLHDFWTRVARRLTATLEEVTADGFVWRVDLRLRPEGRGGPIVNSLAAAERYYESFGRLWERVALLRARPSAGDLAFGEEVLDLLSPFIWRRRVDPRLAGEMIQLAHRARAELSADPSRDLKLGPGGIREAEFFVQALQLIWGGKEPRVRARGTLDGLRRLRAAGFVTDREAQEIALGYLALRRAEHAVQVASGIQTHARPSARDDEERLGRALGFAGADAFGADIGAHMARIAGRFLSLLPEGEVSSSRFTAAIAALERASPEDFAAAIAIAAGAGPSGEGDRAAAPEAAAIRERWEDVSRDLLELARHPDAPLGTRTQETFPLLAETVLGAVLDSADPEQAARYLRIFFARVSHPGGYVRRLGDDPRAVRRLVEALGASAFIGDALANNPELGDALLFAQRAPTPDEARAEVQAALAEMPSEASDREPFDSGFAAPEEELVTALRRAKARVTLGVGLADLASEIDTRQATLTLSALADAELEAATRFALDTPEGEPVKGLSVLAMGKLGGREIGYGSDLDVLFLFDPEAAPPGVEGHVHFARAARRIIRLISVSHAAGPGYELDTRLRPSGNQGLLVTSLEAFARYHGYATAHVSEESPTVTPRVRAAAWERLALLRARAAAGDPILGAEAMRIAHTAAYEMPADSRSVAEELSRLRARLERENSQERHGRYDLKLGRGGLVDIEFAVQLLQLKHGKDLRVRTTEIVVAIDALAAGGYLDPELAELLRDSYAFLRKLEQRIRILHAAAAQLLEERAPGLLPLARRMGIRDRRGSAAAAELIERYRAVTERVRAAYDAIVGAEAGVPPPPPASQTALPM